MQRISQLNPKAVKDDRDYLRFLNSRLIYLRGKEPLFFSGINMKKNMYGLIAMLFSCGILSAQDDISQARWQETGIKPDGSNNEWKKPMNLYDAVTGLLFTITNDSSHLYLCFTNNDERKVTKLMKAGWSVEIYSKEKNMKFNATIAFPAIPMINAPGKDEGVTRSAEPDFKNETALYRLNLQTVSTRGFVSANGELPLLNSNGINIGIGSDNTQAIIYELAIPFKELLPGTTVGTTPEMGLHITVNALKKPAHHSSTDANAAMSDAARMNRVKRSNHGGGAPDNSLYAVDRSLLYTEIDFKQKFRLAKSS